jgi:SRSO17 transposase
MVEPHPPWLERLEEFTDRFRADFRRRDQVRWLAVYLQGLLGPASCAAEANFPNRSSDSSPPQRAQRKTIGTLARHVLLPPDLVVEDVGQALQNFVNQSPWDERLLWRRARALLREACADPDGVFVLEDLAFVKQGRHSVGVQRQYSGALGRKTNCQIAVALSHAGRGGAFPLAMRLYLPRGWLQNLSRLEAAGVPQEYRRPQGRGGIALELLDEARGEGWPLPGVVAGLGYAADRDFRQALADRGLSYLVQAAADAGAGPGERLWSPEPDQAVLTNLPADTEAARLAAFWQARVEARRANQTLMTELGLEHFEGRSWRGFHHHACLAALAFSFRVLEAGRNPALAPGGAEMAS